MTFTEWLLFIHIVAVIAWLGGALFLQILGWRSIRADPAAQVEFMKTAQLGGTVFMVAGLIVLGAGIWMVIDSPVYGFDQLWISFALTVVIISAVLGMAFYGPQTTKALAIAEDEGPQSTAFQEVNRRLATVAALELLALFLVVFAMVFKPGL